MVSVCLYLDDFGDFLYIFWPPFQHQNLRWSRGPMGSTVPPLRRTSSSWEEMTRHPPCRKMLPGVENAAKRSTFEHSYWLQPFPAGWCTSPSYELVCTCRYIYHKQQSFWSYVHQASKLGHLIPLFNLDSQEVTKMGPITDQGWVEAIGHIFGRFNYHLLCCPAVFQGARATVIPWSSQYWDHIARRTSRKLVEVAANIGDFTASLFQSGAHTCQPVYKHVQTLYHVQTNRIIWNAWLKYIKTISQRITHMVGLNMWPKKIPYYPISSHIIPILSHIIPYYPSISPWCSIASFSWSLTARLQTLSGRRES